MQRGMLNYIIRRLIWALIVLFFVLLSAWALCVFGPGDPIQIMYGHKIPSEVIERIRQEMGLDEHWLIQFGKFLWNILQGNFGYSYARHGMPIAELLPGKLWISFQLNALAFIFSLIFGILLGLYAAFRQGKWIDRAIVMFFLALVSMPTLVMVPVMQGFFYFILHQELNLIPAKAAFGGWAGGIFDIKIILPLVIMSMGIVGLLRWIRAATLEVMFQDYVRVARAKGIPEGQVIWRHIFRNVLIPFSTLLIMSLPGLMAGSLIVEMLLGIPGMGRFAYDAIFAKDYPVILITVLFGTVIFLLATILRDIALAWLNPKIRFDEKVGQKGVSLISLIKSIPRLPEKIWQQKKIIAGVLGIILFFWTLKLVFGAKIALAVGLFMGLAVVAFGIAFLFFKVGKGVFTKQVAKRLMKKKLVWISLAIIFIWLMGAIFAPILAPYGWGERVIVEGKILSYQKPSWDHLFGTDAAGYDVFSRVLYGLQTSFLVAFVVASITVFLGVFFGTISAYYGRWIDTLIMRKCEFFIALPDLLFLILIAATLGPTVAKLTAGLPLFGGIADYLTLFLALSFIAWAGLAINIRTLVLSLKKEDFVKSAKVSGASDLRIIFRHIVPNIMWQVIIVISAAIPSLMVAEVTFSFLGIGIQEPHPSIGRMIYTYYGFWDDMKYNYLIFIPSAVLASLLFAFVLLGDAINDALNPKARR